MSEPADNQRTVSSSGDYPLSGDSAHGAPASNLLNTDFGAYELIEELGRGGMGVVYKARQKDLDRLVAIKVILAGQLATPKQVQRFRDEARAAAKLQHPNVVHIYEAGEVHGQHFFAMEYVAGESLAAVVGQPLEFETVAELVSLVARAVEHLHAHGIVHRDLKPSNILLDAQRRPYVTDFGLAMMLEQADTADKPVAIAGTPNYMAPEQATGAGALIGPHTDVYCLGAVLYHLLTDRPPFQESTTLETLLKVMEGEPLRPRELNPKIPVELETICLRCLEKQPQDRYASAAALADDLDRFLNGDAVEAQPLGLWHSVRTWARRQPALASRLAGLAGCLAIAQIHYELSKSVPFSLHVQVMTVLALWCVASAIWQQLLSKDRWAEFARLAWAGTDVILLTLLLHLLDALISPLVVGYAMLIASAGLWLRKRLVWLVTALSVLGYALLVADGQLRGLVLPTAHWHWIFIIVLLVLGAIVAFQVHRIRKLGRYYKRQGPGAPLH